MLAQGNLKPLKALALNVMSGLTVLIGVIIVLARYVHAVPSICRLAYTFTGTSLRGVSRVSPVSSCLSNSPIDNAAVGRLLAVGAGVYIHIGATDCMPKVCAPPEGLRLCS